MTVQLKPEVEAKLTAAAKTRGLSLDSYVQNVLEDKAREQEEIERKLEGLEATFDRLAEVGKNAPGLPTSAFSRENNHD